MKHLRYCLGLLFLVNSVAYSQVDFENNILKWEDESMQIISSDQQERSYPSFEGVSLDLEWSDFPFKRFRFPVTGTISSLNISNRTYENTTFKWSAKSTEEIEYRWFVKTEKHKRFLILDVIPFDLKNGGRKLLSFDVGLVNGNQVEKQRKTSVYKNQSVLANGDWYEMTIQEDGVYKLTPQYLSNNNIASGNVPINSLQIYGNGSGMLPESNSEFQIDDLEELSLKSFDVNSNGLFDGNDYILFYAKGPHSWEVNGNDEFEHQFNIYSERSSYYLTIGQGVAKNVDPISVTTSPPTNQTNSFDDRDFSEKDLNKVVDTGKQWFEEKYEFTLSFNYGFNFPHIITSEPATITSRAVARSSVSGTRMNLTQAGQTRLALTFPAVSSASGANFVTAAKESSTFLPPSPSMTITSTYNNSINPAGVAWMDYIRIQVRRELNMAGLRELTFRDTRTVGIGNITQFNLINVNSGTEVWDISNIHNVGSLTTTENGTDLSFITRTDTLREFVAIRGDNFPTPNWRGKVENQNLHALSPPELLIVYPMSLEGPALRLAEFHEQNSGYTVEAIPLYMIYHEFGGGSPDLTAIKNLCRMFYSRSGQSNTFKYLTLFGDASYDYKDRLTNNTNLVPTWQSQASFSLNTSLCSDDYYGFLDDDEGGVSTVNQLDLGIGRLTVRNTSEANALVDKIINYSSSNNTLGSWRTSLAFAADDVDESWEWQLLDAAEKAAVRADQRDPRFNQQKIYQDSYTQIVTGGSERYPEAREDLTRSVEEGRLVCAYTGHGGEIGLASERVLQVPDLQTWTNYDRLALFITITCEFTRYDDPKRVSAGEFGLINPDGGFIALYSTQRVVYASRQTLDLTRDIFDTLFTRVQGERITLGDVIRVVKNNNGSSDKLKFSLFGDPAIPLAIPQLNVETTHINSVDVQNLTDTIKALSEVTVKGEVVDLQGVRRSDFNGQIIPVVYDKLVQRATLVNDGVGQPLPFEEQSSVIYRGLAQVNNGEFTFTFVVPLDISYQFGNGRITYYADDGSEDAAGYFDDFIVGGLDTTAAIDDQGPDISLYMNDQQFINGGITNENPAIYALLSDSSGINTIGRGIGHDILAILDDDINNSIVLNDYYTSDLNSYQSGRIEYDLSNISEGPHTLKLRAWDVYNNPSETTVDFVVANSENLALRHVLNYPNPFTTFTQFQFEHNRAGQQLQILIQIFSPNGQLVKTIQKEVTPQGNRISDIDWNGLDDFGDPIGKGVYVYKLSVRSKTDFSQAEEYQKLVILR